MTDDSFFYVNSFTLTNFIRNLPVRKNDPVFSRTAVTMWGVLHVFCECMSPPSITCNNKIITKSLSIPREVFLPWAWNHSNLVPESGQSSARLIGITSVCSENSMKMSGNGTKTAFRLAKEVEDEATYEGNDIETDKNDIETDKNDIESCRIPITSIKTRPNDVRNCL